MVGIDGDLPLCAEQKKSKQINKPKKRLAIETPSQNQEHGIDQMLRMGNICCTYKHGCNILCDRCW